VRLARRPAEAIFLEQHPSRDPVRGEAVIRHAHSPARPAFPRARHNRSDESRLACRQRWGVNAAAVDYKLERPDWLNLTFANSGGAAFHHDAGWPADHLLDIVAAYQRPSDARVIGPPRAPIA
jgi:hypothetical protein